MLLAKIVLGFAGTVAVAGAYTFHEGVVSVQQDGRDGQHVHVWVPAAVVPMALHVVPAKHLDHAVRQAEPWLPLLQTLTRELQNYPDTEFVEVKDANQHVRVRTHRGKLEVDVTGPDENVHVSCPLVMMEDVARVLESRVPAA